jgi:hypothetical protein
MLFWLIFVAKIIPMTQGHNERMKLVFMYRKEGAHISLFVAQEWNVNVQVT